MQRFLWLLPFLVALPAFAGSQHRKPVDVRHAKMAQPGDALPDYYATHDGAADAKQDLKAGRLTVLTFGLQASWSREYRDILQRVYGIELRAVAGCVVSESLVQYVNAYNEVMDPAIAARHGKDLFERVVQQARAAHERRADAGARS
jgi:hypothetical protein